MSTLPVLAWDHIKENFKEMFRDVFVILGMGGSTIAYNYGSAHVLISQVTTKYPKEVTEEWLRLAEMAVAIFTVIYLIVKTINGVRGFKKNTPPDKE